MQPYQHFVAAVINEADAELRQRLTRVSDFDGLEAAARGVADQVGRRLLEGLLVGADERLQARRPLKWREVGLRTRTLISTVGPIRLRRRSYRDQRGQMRIPLDEELGLSPWIRMTPMLQQLAVKLCAALPFGAVAEVLRPLLPSAPGRQTLHRLLGQVGERRHREGEELRHRTFTGGEACWGERTVARLFVESDGKWVHLQRTPGRRDLEVCVGVAHEGWELTGEQRWRLKQK